MFLRRGQFRGPGRGGNDRDRGTNQRHSERQGSAVSIEFGNGHRPVAVGGAVVPPAEDGYATAANPGDNACSLPCSRRPTPSGEAAERMPRGASRMFALCVQGLGSTRTRDRGAKLDDATEKLSPTEGECVVGLPPECEPPECEPPECEPPEQPDWVASFNRLHVYGRPRDELFCSSNYSQPVDSVDESAKWCSAQLGIDQSHCERSETICERTREVTNPVQKPPCNTGSDSGCPVVGGVQPNGVLDGRNVKDRSSTLKSGSRFYESRSSKVAESQNVSDVVVGTESRRQGPEEGATAVGELPHERQRKKKKKKTKKKKKQTDSSTTRRTNSECDTSDEIWECSERVADPKDEADIVRRRQTREECATYPESERRGSRERDIHPKHEADIVRRRQNERHDTDIHGSRESVVDPKDKADIVRRRRTYLEHDTYPERKGSKERVVYPNDKADIVRRRQTHEERDTYPESERLGSRESVVDPKDKAGTLPRRQPNTCTWSDSLCSRESVIHPKDKAGTLPRRKTNAGDWSEGLCSRDSKTKAYNTRRRHSEENVMAENLGSQESFVEITKELRQKSRSDNALHDPKPGQRTTEYLTLSEEEEDWNTDHYATSHQTMPVTVEVSTVPPPVTRKSSLGVADPNYKADTVRVRHVHTEHDRLSASLGSGDGVVYPKDKDDIVQRRQTHEEHDTYPERQGSRGRIIDANDKAGTLPRRQTNACTWSDSLCSRESVVDPEQNFSRYRRRQVNSCGDTNPENRVNNCSERTFADPKKKASDTRRRHSEQSAIAENPVSRERFTEEVRQKSRSDTALRDPKPGLTPAQRTTEYLTVSEEEEDWNTDHYATSRQTMPVSTEVSTVPPPVTRKSSLVSVTGGDNDTRRDISVADNAVGIDDVISHRYCREHYYVISYDMPDMCWSSGSATNISDAHYHATTDDRRDHTDPTVAPVGYNPSRFARPFTRGPMPLLHRSPVPPRLPPDGALYDYDFPAPFSPPEERDNFEDDTRVNGYKRHKSSHQLGNRDDRSGIHRPRPEMVVHSGYRGCAPPSCQSRLVYPPPPHGDGSGSPAQPLMFLDSSGQVWATPPPDRPSQVWYPPYSSPPGWFPPRIQTAPMNASGAPVQPRTTSPIDNNLQILVSCLGPPPPPPPSPPSRSDEPKNFSRAEEKVRTRPATRNSDDTRYIVEGNDSDDTRYVVEGNEQLSHRDDRPVIAANLPSKPPGDLVRSTEAATRYGNNTATNEIHSDSYPKHTRSDTGLSNYTRASYSAEKDTTGCDADAKWATSPHSYKDAAEDSLADDSLMHHCAGMAISNPAATTIENSHQTTAQSSRGKVKFTISHYMPPAMHRSSSFSSVSPVVSTPRCTTDLNATAPCVPLSDAGLLGTPKREDRNDGQDSTGSVKTLPSPIRSPYGPWQLTSTPQDKRSITSDSAIDFPFLTPRRKSSSRADTRRVLASSDTGAVSPATDDAKNQDEDKNQDDVASVSGSIDSDLNLCGLGSSVESSPASSQRVSQFRCCSASSNLSQETWSEQSVSFDDGKPDVAGSDEGGNIEEGEIDCFDGQPRKSVETSHNRYRMFPESSTPSTNPLYRSSGTYGGSYSVEQQTKYTNRAKYNLPPRMQRLLQASAAASRSQALTSKIQPQSMTIGTGTPPSSARTPSPWQNYDWRTRLQDIFRKSSQLLLDSHCHIDFLYDRTGFKGTFKKYMSQNEDTFPENFAGCVTVFCHPHTFSMDGGLWSDLLKEDNVWGAVGCHPKCATNFTARAERAMKAMLKHDKMVAVGEIGLDYSGTFYQHQEVQKEVLARQLKLALEINKPIVIHSRESEADILTELEKHIPRNHKIHRHCFTGSWEEARVWLHKFPNSYIGLTALLTHTSRRAFPLKDVARYIPLDKLLIETDTPYFVPWRIPKAEMEFCHPGMVITVADEIAKLKGIDIDTVLKACYDNTRDMYGI